jgi:hypothetical protein
MFCFSGIPIEARSALSERRACHKMQVSTQWRFPDGRMPWGSTPTDERDNVRASDCDTPCSFSLPHATDNVSHRSLLFPLIGASALGLPRLAEQISVRLSRGHRKVALRTALMHYAGGGEIPAAVSGALEDAAGRCTGRELKEMWSDALAWARLCGAGVNHANLACPIPVGKRGLQSTGESRC